MPRSCWRPLSQQRQIMSTLTSTRAGCFNILRMKYCPNCSADLAPSPQTSSCWNCHAQFGDGSIWKPTDSPSGEFRRFRKSTPLMPREEPDTVPRRALHPVLKVLIQIFLRALVGYVFCIATLVLVLLSSMSGGSNRDVFLLWWASTAIILIWVLLPLRHLLPDEKGTDSQVQLEVLRPDGTRQ